MTEPKSLYLLDGMALVYRAYFAFINRPIRNSKGTNTSALFGFANTLGNILETRKPTHLAVAFDTAVPTERHLLFPAYKAQREDMPEDLSMSIPWVKKMLKAWNIACIESDGYEADDIIGTLARQARMKNWEVFMVTPDKDFAQLVDEGCYIYKPSRQGDEIEIMGVPEVCNKWGIKDPEQVVDILALWGDASDNLPGVPGVGEKTAKKLIAQFGTLENLLQNTSSLKGKQRENMEAFADQARLCKRLATINCEAPVPLERIDDLEMKEPDEPDLKALFIELEFNALGKRLFGSDFKAGRGVAEKKDQFELGLETFSSNKAVPHEVSGPKPDLASIDSIQKHYLLVCTLDALKAVLAEIAAVDVFCFDTETTGLNPYDSTLLGVSLSWKKDHGCYIQLNNNDQADVLLEELKALFANPNQVKVGHNLKFDLSMLTLRGIDCRGELFDTFIAHCLLEPDQRHGMDYLSEKFLHYTPIPISSLFGDGKFDPTTLVNVDAEALSTYASEDADVTLQLMHCFKSRLSEQGQDKVFYEIEMPLLPALVEMELAGVRVDAHVLELFGRELEQGAAVLEERIQKMAGQPFNLNSPKQLGEILFERLKVLEKPKKTRTGQFATNEQVLTSLKGTHPIINDILDYREIVKLKSTYVDALPKQIHPVTGRIHTTFHQCLTSTGRIQSQNPNLQNIPIRTEQGREIRKAFISGNDETVLLSADYSQIELRIMAALSGDPTLLQAFRDNLDIHAATAARVYGIPLQDVDSDMRRKAKMVNFGLMYGMSAFGLSQRLAISRSESKEIMEAYFRQFPGIESFMDSTLEMSRKRGYVESVTGRRRYLPDINSGNATVRGAAERTAINMPIQGSAADMIKIAMSRIHRRLSKEKLKTRMLIQVHDELVFDVPKRELDDIKVLVRKEMEGAITLDVPIVVDMGEGRNWLEAH